MLGNRVDKIETERSVGSPTPEPPTQDETIFTGQINRGNGLKMSSLAARPVQDQGRGMRRSCVHAMQNDALDGLNHQISRSKDMKLAIHPLDGRETHSKLQASGGMWSEEVKLDCLGRHLSGKTLTYYEQQVTQWMTQWSSVEEVMGRINELFRPNVTRTQFLFLSAVNEAVSGADDMLLESVFNQANNGRRQQSGTIQGKNGWLQKRTSVRNQLRYDLFSSHGLGTAKLLLDLAGNWGLPAMHGDVPNAYVKAPTGKNLCLYFRVPLAMEISTTKLKELGVSSSKKVVYDYRRLNDAGFTQSFTDSCLYYDQEDNCIKNLGPVSSFLGMRAHYSEEDGYSLDQEPSICELIAKMSLDQAHSVLTPIEQGYSDASPSALEKLKVNSVKKPTIKRFQSLAGSLLWFARCTRPDISYAVHKLTRRTYAPTTADWALGLRVVKYIKGTKNLKFYLSGEVCTVIQEITFEAFSDADYAGDDETRKSISATANILNGMPVSWSCKGNIQSHYRLWKHSLW
uniref:Polyprotein putative n=1 Tax=Albugo laibachii Nc14 TaxID=890382 RepID=F0W9N1_9STRA|nr:polyprotein putative [Albugo laibachii Nc14]|eukprot:CCA17849.1 polyprotein putative [Albugo laibachii Nc14]